MDTSQLLRGVLPTVVLAAVASGDSHGYSILRGLREAGLEQVGDASVYGALQRLYGDGLVSTHLEPSERGPARRCYTLTPAGQGALIEGAQAWASFKGAIDHLVQARSGERQ
ncbi:MAG TPA: PadR family transcriptional regulator [Propionicimonas sp.]|jgi:PadR family transcriptional regulator PadR